MTRIIQSLSEVARDYEVLFCDLWGCVHNGQTPYPAAVAALQAFRAGGGTVVLMTNAPRPHSGVAGMLARIGLPDGCHDLIVASGDASQEAMMMGAVGRKVWHLGPSKDDAFFEDLPDWVADQPAVTRVSFEEAEGIVCTGPFNEMTETPDDYRAKFLSAKARGLKLLCANPDLVVDYGETRIYCAGALAQLYEEMGGESLYFGKPHPPIYDLARRKLAAMGGDAGPDRILAIGDGINTDVAGGVGEGIDTLFITGGLAADLFGDDVENPDAGLLETWLEGQTSHPVLTMGRLR
ncbi:TIGR01459 family HAD-type hydrolase [Roseicitreum antarcticum]|uniref:HAD-superfamily class IIA hydrolase, TIGR01459 n=1 Tax=Roseicitreum antarcticum TaxID=564137 RepID=A0A1H2RX11_9RHOB|nr:TIGR01459 family HAD-type hydrolase [Roseicitreum antarcticum]SDW24011.1 HAD-superfamily class IIA hydrolase, TIGR01459 [Roseicitreum antarcticum]